MTEATARMSALSDTPTSLDQNRARAHYPEAVEPTRKRNAELTPAQQESIAKVRAAAQELEDARKAEARASAARIAVLRAEWDATLRELGPARIAREVDGLIGESSIRSYTSDLRATSRATD